MTLHDQFVEVIALLGIEAAEPEIVEDDKIRRQIASEDLVVRAVRTRLAQLRQQRVGTNEHHRVAGAHGSGSAHVRGALTTRPAPTPLTSTARPALGGGPWGAAPTSPAARGYSFTVPRATPLARAIARCDSPICQRRTTSTISMRLSSR